MNFMESWKSTVLQLLVLCLLALADASSIRDRRRPFRSIKAPAGQCAICGGKPAGHRVVRLVYTPWLCSPYTPSMQRPSPIMRLFDRLSFTETTWRSVYPRWGWWVWLARLFICINECNIKSGNDQASVKAVSCTISFGGIFASYTST